MARTKREYRARTEAKSTPAKMKPYLAEKNQGQSKFAISLGEGVRITEKDKLVTRNANRSRKKAARQEGRRLINGLTDEF
ncbi:hypothetical protein [Adhaeribacter rhizoryzae]|uniref:Uncharacterized protein n=1 Tax=Adhaeribacter rhizoryzae TaxID=2607907 RepID=A0A5M6D0L6_9BACT|nr:hypothetical protein [Adhaeribacter rhizoryzae]KAA5540833.1 hypothetical protein F0145_22270 [Adhaeribacter rhizoryzae]